MAMIRKVIGIAGVYLLAAGLAAGSRPGLVADDPPRPVDILREALEPARKIEDPVRRDETLRDVADGLALLGDVPAAVTAMNAMANPLTRAGTVPTIAKAQAERGDLAGARRTAEILDNPHVQQGGYRNVTFALVAEALARSGNWDEAVKRARRCDEWGRAYAIADVIRIRAEEGDLDGAIRQVERLENTAVPAPQAGGPPLPSPRRMAIVKLVGILAEKKELDRADRLLDAHPDAMAEGLAAIARVRLKAGDMRRRRGRRTPTSRPGRRLAVRGDRPRGPGPRLDHQESIG